MLRCPPGAGVRPHLRPQSPLSLQAQVYHKPPEVSPCPFSGDVPSQGLFNTARGGGGGWGEGKKGIFPSPTWTETIMYASQDLELLGLTQIPAQCLRQMTGLSKLTL